jgi:hypothetical protein
MRPLRPGSWRPELVVDDHAWRLYDPATQTFVGMPGPFGRERVVWALPNGTGPTVLEPNKVVHDGGGFYLADPDNNLIGMPGLVVARMLMATRTEQTRY